MNATYIVGGIADRDGRLEGASLRRARALGARPVRLPDFLFHQKLAGWRGREESEGRATRAVEEGDEPQKQQGQGRRVVGKAEKEEEENEEVQADGSLRVRSIDDVVSLLGFVGRLRDWGAAARAMAEWNHRRLTRRFFCDYAPVAGGLDSGEGVGRGEGDESRDCAWWGGCGGVSGSIGPGLKGKCDDLYIKAVYRSLRPWRQGGIDLAGIEEAAELVRSWDPCATEDTHRQMALGLRCIDIRGGFRAQV